MEQIPVHLSSPEYCFSAKLLEHAIENYYDESVEFPGIEFYKMINSSADVFKQLFKRFIKDDAEKSINISSSVRKLKNHPSVTGIFSQAL